ncbi:unnamed protein product [Prunus brigantina]
MRTIELPQSQHFAFTAVFRSISHSVFIFFLGPQPLSGQQSLLCETLTQLISSFPIQKMIRIFRNKPLRPLNESPSSYNFLQRCSVSGTAKGKSKTKTALPLKRSKITVKKGTAEPASKGGGGGGKGQSHKDRVEKFYDQCLNAPTPIRWLTPEQREREIQRAKLGLISKERQREIEMLKIGKEKLGIPEKPTILGTPGLDLISLGLVDAEKLPKYNLTVEDGRRLAKEYSRVLMRRHRARQAAESTLLRLKKEAIEALPEHLKAAALVPDLSKFPENRFMATLTPPIEGYIEKVKEAARKSSEKGKLR